MLASTVPGLRTREFYRQHAFVVRLRLVDLVVHHQHVGEHQMGRAMWSGLNSVAAVRCAMASRWRPRGGKRLRQVEMAVGVAVVDGERPAEQLDRRLVVADLRRDQAQHARGVEMAAVEHQHVAAQPARRRRGGRR